MLSAVWIWRYITLNAYFDSFGGVVKEYHQTGEIVPFENDRLGGNYLVDGYSIRVDDFKIQEYDDYIDEMDVTLNPQYRNPEKIALVYITLFNDYSDADGIMLTEFQLHGIDNYVGINWDLMLAVNPLLEGNMGICLPYDTKISMVIPFDIRQDYFSNNTWKQLDSYQWYFKISSWPAQKEFILLTRETGEQSLSPLKIYNTF